jgi:glycerol uptake facilitator-like aquaporin
MMDKVSFAQMGFASNVTESSATPETDGYVGMLGDLPYHIHPTATPDAFAALKAAIADGEVTVSAYAAPIVTLADARAKKLAELSLACKAQLLGGFTSSALGSAHAYPSNDDDQRNLQSAAIAAQTAPAGWTTPLWCASGTPEAWAFETHTAAQVLQVNADWVSFRAATQSKYADLVSQVNAPNASLATLQAIAW